MPLMTIFSDELWQLNPGKPQSARRTWGTRGR